MKKWYILKDFLPILQLISLSLPDDEGGITCMFAGTPNPQKASKLSRGVKGGGDLSTHDIVLFM